MESFDFALFLVFEFLDEFFEETGLEFERLDLVEVKLFELD